MTIGYLHINLITTLIFSCDMKKKEVKHLLGLALRVYKAGGIDEEDAIRRIIAYVCDSYYFNWNIFLLGFSVGSGVGLLVLYFLV